MHFKLKCIINSYSQQFYFIRAGNNLALNPLSANFTKWSNTLKQIADELFECFDHFVGLALKGLTLSLNKRRYIFNFKNHELKFSRTSIYRINSKPIQRVYKIIFNCFMTEAVII